jgi:hypothetical protein
MGSTGTSYESCRSTYASWEGSILPSLGSYIPNIGQVRILRMGSENINTMTRLFKFPRKYGTKYLCTIVVLEIRDSCTINKIISNICTITIVTFIQINFFSLIHYKKFSI